MLYVSGTSYTYHYVYFSLGTEERRGTTFRSSTDEILETLTWNNKTR